MASLAPMLAAGHLAHWCNRPANRKKHRCAKQLTPISPPRHIGSRGSRGMGRREEYPVRIRSQEPARTTGGDGQADGGACEPERIRHHLHRPGRRSRKHARMGPPDGRFRWDDRRLPRCCYRYPRLTESAPSFTSVVCFPRSRGEYDGERTHLYRRDRA